MKKKIKALITFLLLMVFTISGFSNLNLIKVSAALNPYPQLQNLNKDRNNGVPCTSFALQQVYDNSEIELSERDECHEGKTDYIGDITEWESRNGTFSLDKSTGVASIEGGDGAGMPLPYWQSDMEYIKAVKIKKGYISVSNSAFYDCINLTTVQLPYGLTSIQPHAFENCISLESIKIPEELNTICRHAFRGCTNLKEIQLGRLVGKIEEAAFENCNKLTDIYYDGTKEDWDEYVEIEQGNDCLTTANIHFLGKKYATIDTGNVLDCSFTVNSQNYTNFNSTLGYSSYEEAINAINNKFNIFKITLAKSNGNLVPGYFIPGLIQTNQGEYGVCKSMVPQGMCIAGDYILISAYDSKNNIKGEKTNHDNHSSVIYVLDKKSRKYRTTIILKNNISHVGGLCWNKRTGSNGAIYFADSSDDNNYCIRKISYDEIVNAVSTGLNAVKLNLGQEENVSFFKVDNKPSCIAFFNGRIYVATIVDDKLFKGMSYLFGYDWGENGRLKQKTTRIMLPDNTQGIEFVDANDGNTYVITSSSMGRKSTSSLDIYRIINGTSFAKCSLNHKVITMPNMSEDISVEGNRLYVNYESAASKYRLGLDSEGKSNNVVDAVTVHSVFGIFLNNSVNQISDDDDILAEGRCGNDTLYSLNKDGTLTISGVGDMYDYSDDLLSPWNDYSEYVKEVVIGSNINNIGKSIFKNLPNLEKVFISNYIDEDVTFMIENEAFAGCKKIKINLWTKC